MQRRDIIITPAGPSPPPPPPGGGAGWKEAPICHVRSWFCPFCLGFSKESWLRGAVTDAQIRSSYIFKFQAARLTCCGTTNFISFSTCFVWQVDDVKESVVSEDVTAGVVSKKHKDSFSSLPHVPTVCDSIESPLPYDSTAYYVYNYAPSATSSYSHQSEWVGLRLAPPYPPASSPSSTSSNSSAATCYLPPPRETPPRLQETSYRIQHDKSGQPNVTLAPSTVLRPRLLPPPPPSAAAPVASNPEIELSSTDSEDSESIPSQNGGNHPRSEATGSPHYNQSHHSCVYYAAIVFV